jgi:hypothetical protein
VKERKRQDSGISLGNDECNMIEDIGSHTERIEKSTRLVEVGDYGKFREP